MIYIGIDPVPLSYAAGLIDGEGYIGITKRHPRAMVNPKYTARLSVSMTDRRPLEFLQQLFSIPESKLRIKTRRRGNHKRVYSLDVENDIAGRVCEFLKDRLLVKKEQAKIVLALRELQENPRRVLAARQSAKGNRSGTIPIMQLSPSYLKKCGKLYKTVKRLNRRGEGA